MRKDTIPDAAEHCVCRAAAALVRSLLTSCVALSHAACFQHPPTLFLSSVTSVFKWMMTEYVFATNTFGNIMMSVGGWMDAWMHGWKELL